jgi:tRNA(Ile)-lysidine synthetase-like protein
MIKQRLLYQCKKLGIEKGPFLIAVSTGADSMALFHLMLELQRPLCLELFVVHVNHNLRKESEQEAQFLKRLCKEKKIPFFEKVLAEAPEKDVEHFLRKERLSFFIEMGQKLKAKVVLAHHQDDQAETVLKRLFENPRPYKYGGMEEKKEIEGVLFLRPLLVFSKKELLSSLEGRTYFEDGSNRNLKYTRNCMRHLLLPFLEHYFGKTITTNLAQLANRSLELKLYLEKRCMHFLKDEKKGPFGSLLEPLDIEPIELSFLLQTHYDIDNYKLEKEIINSFFENKLFKYKDLIIDKKRIFKLNGTEISFLFGKTQDYGWRAYFLGKLYIPKQAKVFLFCDLEEYESQLANTAFQEHDCPLFLRRQLPFLKEADGLFSLLNGQFLSKKRSAKKKKLRYHKKRALRIS